MDTCVVTVDEDGDPNGVMSQAGYQLDHGPASRGAGEAGEDGHDGGPVDGEAVTWVPTHPANVNVGDVTPAGTVTDTDHYGEMFLWVVTIEGTPFNRRSNQWVDVWRSDTSEGRTMSTSELDVLQHLMIGKTWGAADRLRNAVVLRGVHPVDKPRVLRLIMDAHREHLNWLTVTQRKWQSRTRRPSRARHHDSIAIREQYVRATA